MTKILQKKFVMTAMAAISVLIFVLLGAINGVNFWFTNEQASRILSVLSQTQMDDHPPKMDFPDQGKPNFLAPPINEDTAMSARYFLVYFDDADQIVRTDITRISSVNVSEAEDYGKIAIEKETSEGTCDQFRYRITSSYGSPGKVIVFLDNSSRIHSLWMVLFISVVMGCICWGLMLLLVILLSKKAILPIAQNIEKQKQFVTDAGHEIKTPLAIILANTDAMELHQGTSKWSRNIRNQTIRLNELMQKLLLLAKMDEGQENKMLLSDFLADTLIQELLHPYYPSASLKKIQIHTDLQQSLRMHGDREKIEQILSILFDNAIKYTNPDGEIWVILKKPDKKIWIQVKNTCDALPQTHPEKLFDRFYRGDDARTQKSGGYGIGLSIARSMVHSLHGTIQASYENDHTISFVVKLPDYPHGK